MQSGTAPAVKRGSAPDGTAVGLFAAFAGRGAAAIRGHKVLAVAFALSAVVLAVPAVYVGHDWWENRYTPVPLDTDPTGRNQARDLAHSVAAAAGGCRFFGLNILGFQEVGGTEAPWLFTCETGRDSRIVITVWRSNSASLTLDPTTKYGPHWMAEADNFDGEEYGTSADAALERIPVQPCNKRPVAAPTPSTSAIPSN
jgi:hypothetical protein